MDMIPDNILGWIVLGIGIAVGAGLVYLFGSIVLVVAGIAAIEMAIAGAMGVRGRGASMLASGVDELETYGALGSAVAEDGSTLSNLGKDYLVILTLE